MSGVIKVWVDVDTRNERNAIPNMPQYARDAALATRHMVEVSSEIISSNLSEFFRSFDAVVAAAATSISTFSVEEIELNLAVTAKGGVALIGKVEGGAEAGIKVKLRRSRSEAAVT